MIIIQQKIEFLFYWRRPQKRNWRTTPLFRWRSFDNFKIFHTE